MSLLLLLLLLFIWTMKSIYGKKLTGFTIVVPWNIICNNSNENELKIRFLSLVIPWNIICNNSNEDELKVRFLGFLKYVFFFFFGRTCR